MSEYYPVPFPRYEARTDDDMRARARAFYETIRSRHSCRDFSHDDVPREVIEDCIRAAGRAPSGANHQPWHFAAVSSAEVKARIREGAEAEERAFYAEKASEEWLRALAPLGTDDDKPFLEVAPWLIVIFGQRRGGLEVGDDKMNYYVPESVGIATGFLIAALHHAGLATLTHTPAPMKFLNQLCGRPASDKAMILLVVGKPAKDATMPRHATVKKSLGDITTWL